MFIRKFQVRIRSSLITEMHTSNSCKNLCIILRKCLVEEPDVDKIEEQTVSVRCIDSEEKIQITTKIHGTPQHYLRKKEDPLKNTLNRMHLNIIHPHGNRKRLKKIIKSTNVHEAGFAHSYPDDVRIEVQKHCSVQKVALDMETRNVDAWKEANILKIGEDEFKIRVNAPTVVDAKLPRTLMAGYPVVPTIDLEFANRPECKFMWFRAACSNNDKYNKPKSASKTQLLTQKCCDVNMAWEFLSNTFKYTPSNADIGYKLKLVCVPRRGDIFGFSHEAISSTAVEAGPGICPFEERHLYTSKPAEGPQNLRVLSYNILADIYANTEFARANMYPYCSKYAIDFDYRGQLILKEIIGYNSDIICLQECDLKVFTNFLHPSMKEEGFEGHFQRKAGEMPEGEAILFRESRFEEMRQSYVIVSEALNLDCNQEILKALETCPKLKESLEKRTAVGQIIALRDKIVQDRVICVLNTHLYFRPEATNIRLLQMSVLLNHFKKFMDDIKDDFNDITTLAPLICGDFNSTPGKAVIEFLMNGKISNSHPVWKSENGEQPDLNLEHDFGFFSACGFPKFTNYVAGFHDTLDYIVPGSKYFTVESCIPFPDEEVLKLHVALPSVAVPSDHLALVCDLAWKK